MRASFHISENEKGKRVVSIELAGTSEFDITMFKVLAPMAQGGVSVGRDSLVEIGRAHV